MQYGYDHPELHHPGLVWAPDGIVPEGLRGTKLYKGLSLGSSSETELCRACGWSSSHELYSGYDPRVKICYTRNNIGLWRIGLRWMLRDQPNDGTLGNDYMTQHFLRSQPSVKIPLLKEMRLLSEPDDQVHFTLMSQAQGQPLKVVWPTLSRDEKSSYVFQLADAIKSLRQFRAPTAQKVNGDLPDDLVMGVCITLHPPTCKKIGATNDEWFDNIAPELRHGLAKIHRTQDINVIEEKLQQLKDNFPPSEPYVLSHGDLNLGNVLVKDGQIEAIIDWEMSAYLPWWMEYQRMGYHWPIDEDDPEDELFCTVWRLAEPDVDYDTLWKEVGPKIEAIVKVWAACDIDHPDHQSCWLRPDFCECKPIGGRYRGVEIGRSLGHRIRDPNPALMTPRPPVTQSMS